MAWPSYLSTMGLGIEAIDLRQAAVQHEVDDAFGLGGEVRRIVVGQQTRQPHGAKAGRHAGKGVTAGGDRLSSLAVGYAANTSTSGIRSGSPW